MRRYINALSREKTYIVLQGEQISYKEEKKYLENCLSGIKNNSSVRLLAFSDGKLIGNSDIVLGKGAMAHVGHFGIVVAKEFRGQGIGTLLTQLTLQEAKKHLKGIHIVILGVFASNPAAIRLYKKFGFRHYGTIPKGLYRRGKYIDDLYMYRRI